ncbi:ferredoxin [Cloacibacillus sp. An23]|uniref:ferredoxin n=1 Tax=Cloacibacillus sp. An23 TaxID=1965591 RepID=UPI000B3986EC|nr:ferredoxin [Cloacibacillus sp. An23]OUO95045.1 ferredoxin [Cloacibacillus sp. An23]
MSIKVNLDDCIGCGVCAELCPQSFKLDELEGKSLVISQEVTAAVKEAADSCPVSAIEIF